MDVQLRGIDRLYGYADETSAPGRGLDSALGRLEHHRVLQTLQGLFSRLRSQALRSKRPSRRPWFAARRFAVTLCEELGRIDGPRGLERVRDALAGTSRLEIYPSGPRKRLTRGLPAGVIADLYDLVAPDSKRNPFRTEFLRWRNYYVEVWRHADMDVVFEEADLAQLEHVKGQAPDIIHELVFHPSAILASTWQPWDGVLGPQGGPRFPGRVRVVGAQQCQK